MTDVELIGLIERIADRTFDGKAKLADAWDACREAERIRDVDLLPTLEALLMKAKHKDLRRAIYFILSHVGRNTGDAKVVDLLTQSLRRETDKYVLHFLLLDLERQPRIGDGQDIIPYSKDSRWLVRQAALQALGSCPGDDAEEALLEVLREPADEYDLFYANHSLFRIGTPRAVPLLELVLSRSRTDDAKCSAIGALSRIGGKDLLPAFLEALECRSSAVKWTAVSAIHRHGDERAVEPLCPRVRVILKRDRKLNPHPPSELDYALDFLERYRENRREVEKVFQAVRERWSALFDDEREWLRENIPYFADCASRRQSP